MVEDANQDVAEEVVPPAQDQSTHEGQADQERNWRKTREQLDYQRSEIEELKAKLEARNAPPEQPDPMGSLEEDDVITVKEALHLAKKAASEEFGRHQKARDLEELPSRLKARFPDFDSVVTKENVEKLKAQRPELIKLLASSSDPYGAAVAAYDLIVATSPEAAKYSQYRDRLEANAKKPLSPSAAPSSMEGSDRMSLTKEGKESRFREMQKLASRA